MTLEIKALRVVSLLPFIHERKSFDQIVKLFKRHDCIIQFLGALQLHIDYLKIYHMYSLTDAMDRKTLSLSLSMLMYLANNPKNNWSWNKKQQHGKRQRTASDDQCSLFILGMYNDVYSVLHWHTLLTLLSFSSS